MPASFECESLEGSKVQAKRLCKRVAFTAPVIDLPLRMDSSEGSLFDAPVVLCNLYILCEPKMFCKAPPSSLVVVTFSVPAFLLHWQQTYRLGWSGRSPQKIMSISFRVPVHIRQILFQLFLRFTSHWYFVLRLLSPHHHDRLRPKQASITQKIQYPAKSRLQTESTGGSTTGF